MDANVSMFPSLALNSANVPGGLVAVPCKEIVTAGGLDWLPVHAKCDESPIGYTLAMQLATSSRRFEES